jgi:hypothetical protein
LLMWKKIRASSNQDSTWIQWLSRSLVCDCGSFWWFGTLQPCRYGED